MSLLQVCPLLLMFPMVTAGSTTHPVLPGTSIQEKVDLAEPGDVIAIFGGTYQQNVTVDKTLHFVPAGGQSVTITGTFSVAEAEGVTVQDVDIQSVSQTGGELSLSSLSILGNISQSGGRLMTHSVEINGNFDSTSDAEQTIAFRTKVDGTVTWRANRAWFGYSESGRFRFLGSDAHVVVVGSRITITTSGQPAIRLSGSDNQYRVLNSTVKYVTASGFSNLGISVTGSGHRLQVLNNFVSRTSSFRGGTAISVSDAANARIANNIITDVVYGINAPFGLVARNNLYWGVSNSDTGGFVHENRIDADPLFVEGEEPKLQPDSPAHNAGDPDPIYANRDGSRNTIGPSGGAWFDPDGWTTENPVVISFDLGPEVLLEGTETEVILSNAQAVSHP